MRSTESEFARLDLRAHSLLADVPVHDVWTAELTGGGPGRNVLDLQSLLSLESFATANPAVRFLFWLRNVLGDLAGWDATPAHANEESFLHRLSAAERAASLIAPGTPQGPFYVLYVSEREAISEIRNATVHAFSVFTLQKSADNYRLYWAIYVRPVGRITAWYMRLIDPFRRLIIYPAILKRLRTTWAQQVSAREP